jgi:hypothetical protein
MASLLTKRRDGDVVMKWARKATKFGYLVATLMATGLSSRPRWRSARGGRLFVCPQGGQLRVIKNGALLGTPFLSVTVLNSHYVP